MGSLALAGVDGGKRAEPKTEMHCSSTRHQSAHHHYPSEVRFLDTDGYIQLDMREVTDYLLSLERVLRTMGYFRLEVLPADVFRRRVRGLNSVKTIATAKRDAMTVAKLVANSADFKERYKYAPKFKWDGLDLHIVPSIADARGNLLMNASQRQLAAASVWNLPLAR